MEKNFLIAGKNKGDYEIIQLILTENQHSVFIHRSPGNILEFVDKQMESGIYFDVVFLDFNKEDRGIKELFLLLKLRYPGIRIFFFEDLNIGSFLKTAVTR